MRKTTAELLATGDVDALLAFHRVAFGDARMEDPPTPPTPPAPAPTPVLIPQETVNATVARETAKAKTDATNEMLAKLGYATVEEAEAAAKAARDAADALKSQQQRDADAAAKAKTDAEAEKAEAAREKHEAKIERALSKAGLDVDNDTILRAALAAIDVTVGADADAIKAAVEKAKTDAPQLFGAAPAGGGGKTTTDPGGQRRTTDAPSGEFGPRGKAEAERRWGKQDQQRTA